METSNPLAIESFSKSWLSNRPPSLDRPIEHSPHHESEQHPEESHNFDFNVSVSGPSPTFVHADELFSNGLIRPASAESPAAMAPERSEPSQPVPAYLPARIPTRQMEHSLLRRWRRSSEQVWRKCFRRIRSLYRKEGLYTRKNVRVDDMDRRANEVRSWHGSPLAASPSHSVASYSAGEWSDIENSIYEAVLHCKRSIGTLNRAILHDQIKLLPDSP